MATQAVATQADDNSGRWQLRPVATQAGGNQGQDIMNIELTLIKMQGYKRKKGEGKYTDTDDESMSDKLFFGKMVNVNRG